MYAELVLVRHGESMGNLAAAAAIAAGAEVIELGYRDPDVPLSPVGVDQARALGRGLASLLSDGLVRLEIRPASLIDAYGPWVRLNPRIGARM